MGAPPQNDAQVTADRLKISGEQPTYSARAAALGVEAEVNAKICVSPTGNVTSVGIVAGHPAFDDDVKTKVMTWRFRPFLVEGLPRSFCYFAKFVFKPRAKPGRPILSAADYDRQREKDDRVLGPWWGVWELFAVAKESSCSAVSVGESDTIDMNMIYSTKDDRLLAVEVPGARHREALLEGPSNAKLVVLESRPSVADKVKVVLQPNGHGKAKGRRIVTYARGRIGDEKATCQVVYNLTVKLIDKTVTPAPPRPTQPVR
jgi:TonB family protein